MVSIKENVVFWFFDFRPLRVPNGATKFWEIRKNALSQGSSDSYNFSLKIIQNTQLFVKDLTRAIKKYLCHFRVRQIFKAENLNLNLKIKNKPTKLSTTPTFSLLKRWPYKYWRLPRKKIDGLLNSNGGFLILFLMWNTLKSVYYVKIHLFWMVRSNLRGHNHDMWRNIYMPLLFNVFGATKMPLRRI